MNEVKIGEYYTHYKHPDKFYKVLAIANHSESLEKLVIYQALYESEEFGKDAVWARPLAMFLETVEKEGKTLQRFKHVGSELPV